MVATYIGVCSREIINIFLLVKCLGLSETFIGIYSDTIHVMNVKLCMMVLLIEFNLFMPFSATLTIFQDKVTATSNSYY